MPPLLRVPIPDLSKFVPCCPRHADNYLAFLDGHINLLGETYAKGKTVENRPDLRYILIRRKSRGNGHLAVYTVEGKVVTVVHVFHTAQDWQAKL